MAFPPTSNPFAGLLDLVDRQQKDRALEESLARWERPASDSEEDMIQRAARMVRDILSGNLWLRAEGVQVEPQGSYHNNTNVRQQADMDLRVVHPGLVVWTATDVDRGAAARALGYCSTGRSNPAIAAELRRQVEHSLVSQFGRTNVTPGKRAFHVKKVPGSRADIDVVPALKLHYVYSWQLALLGPQTFVPVEGIMIYGTGGRLTMNFPDLHHQNGIAKRERTRHRFKRVVRTLKRMRDLFVERQLIRPDDAQSFLIESLVYQADDNLFRLEELRAARLRRILSSLNELLANPFWVAAAREINDVKLLFTNDQPWTANGARRFAHLALTHLQS